LIDTSREATSFRFIDSDALLSAATAQWAQAEWLALDTEFVRETTYFPRLCLVQCSDGAEHACIDAIALDAALQPMFDALTAPAAVKVFHSASQDLEIFVQHTGTCPRPLFDTQLAAALLGDGDQLGYAALVEKRLGVQLDKSLTRTDWARRPLSAAELAYAADDVRWLAELFPRLRDELVARGRLAWLEEDCARLVDPERYRTHPEDAWRRLKGLARLPVQAQRAAVALAAWRERVAQARNRPRKWILDDSALYRIAERIPETETQLADLHVLPPKTLARHGTELIAVLAEGMAKAEAPAQEPLLDSAQKAHVQTLLARLKQRAETAGVPPSLLATRADVETLVRGSAADVPLTQGWRRELAGDLLGI
jgi:ribonuclease D